MALQDDRLDYIDGLRGVAVLCVLLFHAAIWGGNAHVTRLLAAGRSGVDLFLVLSGFCLFRPLVRSRTGVVGPLKLKQYAMRRTRRIYPPYLVAVLIAILVSLAVYLAGGRSWWTQPFQDVFPWHGSSSAINLGSHLLLVHGFSNHWAHSIDGAFWSLSVEWQFYWLLPILVLIARRFNVWTAVAVTFAVSVFGRLGLQLYSPALLQTYVGNELFFSRWAEFGAGILAAAMTYQLCRRPRWCGIHLLVAAMLIAIALETLRPAFVMLPIAWGLIYGLLTVLSSVLPAIRRLFEFQPLVRIGVISYSLYLVHGSIFMLMSIPLSRWSIGPLWRELICFVIGIPLSIAVARIMFAVVERPFLTSRTQASLAARPLAPTGSSLA